MLGKVHVDMLTGTFKLTQGGRVLNSGHTTHWAIDSSLPDGISVFSSENNDEPMVL
jgi:hypothetical protein